MYFGDGATSMEYKDRDENEDENEHSLDGPVMNLAAKQADWLFVEGNEETTQHGPSPLRVS